MTIPQPQAPQIPTHIPFSSQTNPSQQLCRPGGTPAAGFGFQALSRLHSLVSINPEQTNGSRGGRWPWTPDPPSSPWVLLRLWGHSTDQHWESEGLGGLGSAPSSSPSPQTGAPWWERGPGIGTASVPRQPSELRSSRGFGGAEQSPKQCQEQGPAPWALPALHPHPNPILAHPRTHSSSPAPLPSASQPLQKFTISVLSRRGTLRFLPGNAAMWPTPSRVPLWGHCPALSAAPLAVGQPVPCSRATPRSGSSLAHPVGSSPCPQPAGGSREDGICPTHLEPLSAACWDGASSFSLFSSSFSSSSCVAARDQLVLIRAGMGRGCGRPGKGRQPSAPSQMNSSWG